MKERKRGEKSYFLVALIVLVSIFFVQFVSANRYVADLSFFVPKSVYSTGERIELKGSLSLKNFTDNGTLVSGLRPIANATINLTIRNSTVENVSSYNFTTDVNGFFYSRSDYHSTAPLVSTPPSAGEYTLRASYIDPNNVTWFSEIGIRVINKTIDQLRVSSDKYTYNPSDSMGILVESFSVVGDRILFVSNVSVNGSIRNAINKSIVSSFGCTTGNNGKCTVITSAPSSYGSYILELNNFKAFSGFSVVPFFAQAYMKDELGESYKNIFSVGEQASIDVSVVTNSTTERYTFSGYIADMLGNVVKAINTTILNSNNSYTNKFVFTVDSLTFKYGFYYARINVTKIGDGSIDLIASFEVKDWDISFVRKDIGSGFEYDYSVFPNKTMKFEVYPKHRVNGSIIPNINSSSFIVNLTDKLNNNLASANVIWNASCNNGGCYEFSLVSPLVGGRYAVLVTLFYLGDTQNAEKAIYVIDTVVSAQSTNIDGDVKELFGTNEFIYLSLSSYNNNSASVNLSDAEIFSVSYMNGSEISYTNVSSFSLVNNTNSVNEWAWNSTLQRFKLDAPKTGGLYTVTIFAKNRSAATATRFIINPYDICTVAKNTPGQVSGGGMSSGSYYYVWQFKTTDTVYFELKVIQANNPLGKATLSNFTSAGNTSGQYGMSSGCSVNTQTQQVVSNATITIVRVVNTQTGAEYSLNTSQSVCAALDNSGGYTCTVAPGVKWDGGTYSVEMKIIGQDGSSDIAFGIFEARAFYLYGYSNVWQNTPSSNITLTVRMYEAGKNWWSSYGSGGLAGSVKVEKIEYMGKEGDWIWPPVDSGYNVSRINTTTISTGSGAITLPASNAKRGLWDTGSYRVILKGADTSGNSDYGYAWFMVRLWDVYGTPIECTATRCDYKSYFNSRENITLYIKIGNAGAYNYNEQGGQSIGGNVTISVKKIQDCRRWPCKELNASEYISSRIVVNASNGWYWGANISANSTTNNYILRINKTDGRWGSGWYSVVLDVNGTDTGYAYFNAIAFYVDSRPTNLSGADWKYNIKPGENMYFNVSVTKNYVWWGYNYNSSDYLNATIDDVVLRTWDQITYQSKEYNYPEDINITIVNKTILQVTGNNLLNLSYRNGSWPIGYYWGELIMRNLENETSTGWLWFSVQPFRVEINNNNYEIDSDICVNTTLTIREPDWSSNSVLIGNYSIISVYENVWSGSGSTLVVYNNYTNASFNGTLNAQFCPNSGRWGSGSWGGYHNLNVVVKDNNNNDTQSGWLSFRTVPFRITWSVVGGSDKRTNQNVNVSVSLTKAVSGVSTSGNLSRVYQWRWEPSTYTNTFEEYSFTVYTNNGSTQCSSTSGNCFVNGSATVIINAPSNGWRVGGNYLQSDWISSDGTSIQDYSGIYINGLDAYNGWFDNVDANGNWRNGFGFNENVTLRITVRNSSYNNVGVNITSIQYGYYTGGCYDSWCVSYTTATWSFVSGGSGIELTNGSGIFRIHAPSGGWSRGSYTVKATVSGGEGTSTITGGSFQIKDLTPPNVSISSPTINQTITNQTFSFSATSTKNSICNIYSFAYGDFYNWYCGNLNSSNGTVVQQSLINACNKTYYGFNNATQYQIENVYRDYYSFHNSTYSEWRYIVGISTGGTTHTYTMNITNWRAQDYGIYTRCSDEDNNQGVGYVAIHVNTTGS